MKFQYKMYEKINGIATIEFMKQLEAAYPNNQKIHLILDNAGYHRSAEVEEYLKTSRVRVLFLPPRSPNLNSIERLWKIMHEYVSNNRVHAKFEDFKKAVLYFFKCTTPTIFDILVSRLTDGFTWLLPQNDLRRVYMDKCYVGKKKMFKKLISPLAVSWRKF